VEALEVGAPADEPQLPAPGAGAVISVRAAVDPVSPRRQVPRCEQEPAKLGVPGHPAATATDRNDRRRRLVDALYALAYLGSGDPDSAQGVVIDAFTSLCGDPRATCSHQRWRLLADHVHQANETSGARPVPGLAPLRDAGLSRPQQQAIALCLATTPDRQAARLLGLSLNRYRRHLRTGLKAMAGAMPLDLRAGYRLLANTDDVAAVQP
jgi:hypothetical protein